MENCETDVVDTLNPSNDPEFEDWLKRSNEMAASCSRENSDE